MKEQQELIFLREFAVHYWLDGRMKKPLTSGYPKTENGEYGKSNGAAGAVRTITQGFAVKVQCVHRPTGRVLWTAEREKIAGVHVYGVKLTKGDPQVPRG